MPNDNGSQGLMKCNNGCSYQSKQKCINDLKYRVKYIGTTQQIGSMKQTKHNG